MRVISGSARGRAIKAPNGMKTRPTTDRVREALFNILTDFVYDSCCLDLFAGSGALGIEAISRGAHHVVFVDQDFQAHKIICSNLQQLNFAEQAKVLKMDSFAAVVLLNGLKQQFDLVFLDPPYTKGLVVQIMEKLAQFNLVAAQGIIAAETNKEEELPQQVADYQLVRSRKYGDTKLWFYQIGC